ncbi:MAG: hypothetical protein JWP12_2190 [Bacteroidetes bacterium]|nr:hypothetical protein [Bacteroidota bacterium]
MNKEEVDQQFEKVLDSLAPQFGGDIDEQAILFLIGVQELGKGNLKFTKTQKLDVMHIAICTLLTPYGYYEYEGLDKDGWPHWKVNEKLPPLKPNQQHLLIKQAIVEYFTANELMGENDTEDNEDTVSDEEE